MVSFKNKSKNRENFPTATFWLDFLFTKKKFRRIFDKKMKICNGVLISQNFVQHFLSALKSPE